jgi:tetratricopeptide (TPR) repeat protein
MRVLVSMVKDVQPERVVMSHEDVQFRYFKQTGKTIRQILFAWRDTWTPDLIMLGAVPFLPIPLGLAAADAPPLVFYLDDWHHSLASCLEICDLADLVLTDPRGVAVLNRHGYDHAAYYTRQHYHAAFDPPEGHGEPLHDIGFAGTIDDPIYQRRSRLFPTLARFADRYRVLIVGNIFGDAYQQSITGSRIGLNQSVRGELNRRTYEILSAGRVLLMEADNDEGQRLFRDGEHCVFYTEDTLAERLQWLLDHPEECDRIGRQGQQWARQFGPDQRWANLLEHLRTVNAGTARRRRWSTLPPAEQGRILALQALARDPDENALHLAEQYLSQAEQADPGHVRVQHGLAVCALHRAQATPLADARTFWLQRCCRRLQLLTNARPDYVMAWVSLGLAFGAAGQEGLSCQAMLRAMHALVQRPFLPATEFISHLPRGMRFEWNRALSLGEDLPALVSTMLATWIASRLTDSEPPAADAAIRQAEGAPYDIADYWWQSGLTRMRLGDPAGALTAWQRATALAPLNFSWRERQIQTALDLGELTMAQELIGDAERLLMQSSDQPWRLRIGTLQQRLEHGLNG